MNIRSLYAATAAAGLVLSLAACGSDDGGDAGNGAGDTATGSDLGLVADGTLTVCSEVPYPPFEDFDPSSPSGFTGFDMDIVQAIADGLELELAVKDSNFEALQSGLSLNAGECDLVASAMTINEERAANLDFSEGYYESQQSLLVPADSDITSIGDLDGRRVGVQQATTGASYAEENATGATLVTFPGDPEMFQALRGGQVDALLQDLPVNILHTADGEFTVVEEYPTGEEYGLAMKKGNTALVEAVDGELQELRDSGTYDEIYDTYFTSGGDTDGATSTSR